MIYAFRIERFGVEAASYKTAPFEIQQADGQGGKCLPTRYDYRSKRRTSPKDVRSCGGHLERLFGSGLIFVPGIPECPFVLKSTSVYHAKLQLRNLAVLGQRVDPPVSMFGNHASE